MAQWQLSEIIQTALGLSTQARQYQVQTKMLTVQCETMHRQANIAAQRMHYEHERYMQTLRAIADAFAVSLHHNRRQSQQLAHLCVSITRQLSTLTQCLTDRQMSAEQLVQLNALIQTLHQQQSALITAHGVMGNQSIEIYRSSGLALGQL
ncbi:hypothetical protein [Psychrobacter jeotgali]|uniref:hypothetical protein n=1 Tax=Psychrobacter jeotgali TaxID=179010 RepID=UPI00191A1882|nr:hypothetical protein [Psychrobacter jeotgali]